MSENQTATTDATARADTWLFDLVSGLASGPDDWEPVARHCSLLEWKAREITAAVLAPEFIARVSRGGA